MKKQKSTMVLLGLVLGIFFLNGCMVKGNGELQVLTDETYPADGIQSVEIDGTSGDIEVLRSTDGQFRIYETCRIQGANYSYDVDPCEVRTSGDTFYVKCGSAHAIVLLGSMSHKIEIYLPDTAWDNYTISLTSGSLSSDDITAKEITLEGSSGSISASNLTADSVYSELTSGDIKLRDLTVNDLQTEISSGEIDISTVNLPENIDLRVTSGDASIRLPDDSKFSIDYQYSSGDIRSDFGHDFGYDNDNFSGQTGSEGPVYKVRLSSGSIEFID